MPPKKVNLAELDRDELIAVVHKINGQLLAAQQNGGDMKAKAAMDRALAAVEGERDEYMLRLQSSQEQIALLKDELSSRGDEVSALSNQLAILSDQLIDATSALKQHQQSTSIVHNAPPPVPAAEPIKPSPPVEAVRPPTGVKEVEALQERIVDLQETLDYYAAIVQSRDAAEAQRGQKSDEEHNAVSAAVHQEVVEEAEAIREQLDATEQRCSRLREELAVLRESHEAQRIELTTLAAQLVGMDSLCRGLEVVAASDASNPDTTNTHHGSDSATAPSSSTSISGKPIAAKILFESGNNNIRSPRPRSSVDGNSTVSELQGHPSTRGRRGSTVLGGLPLLDFASLPDRNIKNPNPREKKLLDRLDAVERYALSLADYDVTRQRSYDELDRNRADLFAFLNESNQAQHEKIQTLQRSVAARDKRIAELESGCFGRESVVSGSEAAFADNSGLNPTATEVPLSVVNRPNLLDSAQQTFRGSCASIGTNTAPISAPPATSSVFSDSLEMSKRLEAFGPSTSTLAQRRLIDKIHVLERRELQSEAMLKMLRVHHESVLVRSADFCEMLLAQSSLLGKEVSLYRSATEASGDAIEVKASRHHLLQRLSMRLMSHPAKPPKGWLAKDSETTRSRSSLESLHTADAIGESFRVINDSLCSNPAAGDDEAVTSETSPLDRRLLAGSSNGDCQATPPAPPIQSPPYVEGPTENRIAVTQPKVELGADVDASEDFPVAEWGGHTNDVIGRVNGSATAPEDRSPVVTVEPTGVAGSPVDDGWDDFVQAPSQVGSSQVGPPPPQTAVDFDPFA